VAKEMAKKEVILNKAFTIIEKEESLSEVVRRLMRWASNILLAIHFSIQSFPTSYSFERKKAFIKSIIFLFIFFIIIK
jgi:hypothetical protein